MNGRLEEELKVEYKITEILTGEPQIIRDYYHSFLKETYNTKLNYVKNAIAFANFMNKNYKIDFNNIDKLKNIRPLHINNYIRSYEFKNIKRYDLREYSDKTDIRNSNSYKANKLAGLKNFFEFLFDNEIIETNPCAKIKNIKDNKIHEIVSLTPDEIKTIKINIINGVGSKKAIGYQRKWINRDMSIILLGISTGLRVSAICNINVQDIVFQDNTIKVIEKGGVERKVYLPDNAVFYIKEWLKDRDKLLNGQNLDALFISRKMQRIATGTIRDMLKKYTYNIDKNITPHKLRSTTATNLLEKTGDIYLVAEILGHKNIQNTKRYARVSVQNKKNAANILGNII